MKISAPLLFFASALITVASVQAQTTTVVPPSDLVNDMSQAEWSRAWWQWAG